MKYRPEIDGLRAIAVIPVILFHAKLQAFSGGFIGVDIFFVISGYLITSIILHEMEQGTFSLINFYERRARRILPALFLVMLVSLPFAWLWLMPNDMEDFLQSLVAVSLFSSNILFWQESGYWDTASELKPLLHTWSLAVEEQFYVIFPLFLILMRSYQKFWIFSLFTIIAVVSFCLAQYGAYHKPSATFYLLPTRGWELAIGASIAFYFSHRKHSHQTSPFHKIANEILGLLGILMIGYSIFSFNQHIPFPSLYTLLPTMGTGLIILFSSSQTIVGRSLSAKPLVAIGLISYSAYLWHQPLLAYLRHRSLTEPNELTLALIAVLSLPIAYLSWQFAEKPFRRKDIIKRKTIFISSLIATLAFITIGLIGNLPNVNYRQIINSQASANLINDKLKINYGLNEICDSSYTLSAKCRTNNEPEILVWGDSYAMHLVQGILASKPDARIIQMTQTMCGPFFNISPVIEPRYPVSWARNCLEFTGHVREWLKKNTTVKYAILSSPFNQYLDSDLLFRSNNLASGNIELIFEEFGKTLNEIKQMGITPVVFSPPPRNGDNIGKCLSKATWMGLNLDDCNFIQNEISQQNKDVYKFLRKISNHYSVIFLNDLICNTFLCRTHFDNTFLYRDDGHLSIEGSIALGKKHDFYKLITNK